MPVMATKTLYRPVGTAEIALLAQGSWKRFPEMPFGFSFYAYTQPPGDIRGWAAEVNDPKNYESLECGQAEVVKSWDAWRNAPDSAFVVWFEVDENFWPGGDGSRDVFEINDALVGPIEVCARYEQEVVWTRPSLRG